MSKIQNSVLTYQLKWNDRAGLELQIIEIKHKMVDLRLKKTELKLINLI